MMKLLVGSQEDYNNNNMQVMNFLMNGWEIVLEDGAYYLLPLDAEDVEYPPGYQNEFEVVSN